MKSITMLKLKLVDPPLDQLDLAAKLCRHARNAGLENWLLRQRGMPETPAQSAKTQRRPRRKNPGDPVPPLPDPREKSEATKIYQAMVAAVPELSPDIISSLSAACWANLNAKLDWRRRTGDNGGGEKAKPRRRRDAIIDYEDRPPWFTEMSIPTRNKHTTINFDDRLIVVIRNVIRPYEDNELTLELSLKNLPPTLKKLIRRVQFGELKHSDSALRFWRDAWYLFWPVQHDDGDIKCDPENVTHLWPSHTDPTDRQSDRPFVLCWPGRRWTLGDGRYLLGQTQRLIGLRKTIGYRYRHQLAKGHGRQKIDTAIRLRVQQMENIRKEFRRKMVCDIIRQCERSNCGTVIYHEPTNPAKDLCWFARNDLEFDWTAFLTDLKNSCAARGIAVKCEKLKIGDILPSRKGEDETAA